MCFAPKSGGTVAAARSKNLHGSSWHQEVVAKQSCRAAGGERQPEVAGQVFACAAGVCRALAKPLAADPPRLLGASVRLRYARAEYVRRLAAQAFGPVLRRAPPHAVRASVAALLAGAAQFITVAC